MSMEANPDAPQYDWSSRVRTTAKEALRYSKFVSLMKRLLSLGAFLIIAAVLAFFFVQRQPRQLTMSYEMLGRVENDLAMVKPRLTGADAKGNPFVITADMAVQDAKNAKKASLKNPNPRAMAQLAEMYEQMKDFKKKKGQINEN